MSEPQALARRGRRIVSGLVHFSVKDDRIDQRSESYALKTRESTVLIDPLPMSPSALASLGEVVAICLTIQSHQRASWRLRSRFGAPVYAPSGSEGLEQDADVYYEDGDDLPGGLRAIHAPGPAYHGYVLVHERPQEGAIVFLGDLLIRKQSGALGFVPDRFMDDPDAARISVKKLLAMPIGVLCPGHGAPILGGARNALWRAIERDDARRARPQRAPASP